MKFIAALLVAAAALPAADALKVFGRDWTVPVAADWKVDREDQTEVLRIVQKRGPVPGPRRPIQFALTALPDYAGLSVEVEVKPLARSLLLAFAYRDEAHFNYVHLSTDTSARQPLHNGIFHVYGGERVRISKDAGPAAFPADGRWYRVKFTHAAASGAVDVTVDGQPLPALRAVDLSLGPGKFGLGSFDEIAEFRNLRIQAATR